eukprot:323029-Chlamydomonas_euryale.AAC.2
MEHQHRRGASLARRLCGGRHTAPAPEHIMLLAATHHAASLLTDTAWCRSLHLSRGGHWRGGWAGRRPAGAAASLGGRRRRCCRSRGTAPRWRGDGAGDGAACSRCSRRYGCASGSCAYVAFLNQTPRPAWPRNSGVNPLPVPQVPAHPRQRSRRCWTRSRPRW